MTNLKFSELIKAYRSRLGFTQAAMAKALSTDDYEVKLRTLQEWERGNGPSGTMKALIVNLLRRIEKEKQI